MSAHAEHGYEEPEDRLVVPEFVSAIPPHLLDQLSDKERWQFNTLSEMAQKLTWVADQTVESRVLAIEAKDYAASAHTRVDAFEKWRTSLTSRWSMAIGVVAILAPALVKTFFDRWFPPGKS
jgi:hypothetical protein